MNASLVVAVLLVGSVARAEPSDRGFDLVVGLGFPAGGAGLGVHTGRIEVLVEAEGIVLGPGVAGTATLASNIDVLQRPRYGLYVGVLATVIGLAVAGGEDTATDGYLGGGAVAGARLHGPEGSISHAFEVGLKLA